MTGTPDGLARLRHELRTPLNHIIGYAELLARGRRAGPRGAGHRPPTPARRCPRGSGAGQRAARPRGERCRDRGHRGARPGRERAGGPHPRRNPSARAWRRGARRSGAASGPRADRGGRRPPDQAAQPREPGRDGARRGRRRKRPPAEPALRGVILVVDDDQGNRDLLARRLIREGFAVHTAPDGHAALETLGHQSSPLIDLVLLDVMMPGIDGYEVLRRLKGDAILRELPVLMISALDEVQSVVRCIELGAEDYLPKPFDPVLLRARIGACLEKKRLRDQRGASRPRAGRAEPHAGAARGGTGGASGAPRAPQALLLPAARRADRHRWGGRPSEDPPGGGDGGLPRSDRASPPSPRRRSRRKS